MTTGCLEFEITEETSVAQCAYYELGTDANTLTVAQIKGVLDNKGVSYNSRDTKETLIALLGGAT